MKTFSALLCIIFLSALLAYPQKNAKEDQDQALRKMALLSDVKTLAIEIPKLDGTLAQARADAEIADAAWVLDQEWAKSVLRDAYRLTYPTDEEQSKFPPQRRGAAPKQPSEIDSARSEVRERILSVARREKAFADQLMREGASHLTKDDRQLMYTQLARTALDEGDNGAASQAIEQSMQVDPTQLAFIELVNDLATKDRAAADKLILQCVAELSTLQLSNRDFSASRADMTLRWLVFPNAIFGNPNKPIPNPGPEVMRAYVIYIIGSLSSLEQREPGSLRQSRSVLLSAWLPLNTYAPELKGQFMQMEALSRTPGKDASLPTQSYEEADKERFRKRDNEALNSNEPSDLSIGSAITREDFETARKLIGKLPDGDHKTDLTEQVNAKEALSLTKKGDLFKAQSLAQRLTRVSSTLQVYPLLIQRYATNKDAIAASAALHEAILKIKHGDAKPTSAASFGMPASFVQTTPGSDPVLSGLGRLAKAILPIDGLLGAEVVDEMVAKANGTETDTKQGRLGIDSDVFKKLAGTDENRARSAAENLKKPLQRIVAVAAIYQWKAKEFEKNQSPSRSKVIGQGP